MHKSVFSRNNTKKLPGGKHVMANKEKENNKSKEMELQNKTNHAETKESVTAQKDGFRYDYNDSSDFDF
jgi:hypothetical protein